MTFINIKSKLGYLIILSLSSEYFCEILEKI